MKIIVFFSLFLSTTLFSSECISLLTRAINPKSTNPYLNGKLNRTGVIPNKAFKLKTMIEAAPLIISDYKSRVKEVLRPIPAKDVTYKNTIQITEKIEETLTYFFYNLSNQSSVNQGQGFDKLFQNFYSEIIEISQQIKTNKNYLNRVKNLYKKRKSLPKPERLSIEYTHKQLLEFNQLTKKQQKKDLELSQELIKIQNIFTKNLSKASSQLKTKTQLSELKGLSFEEIKTLKKVNNYQEGEDYIMLGLDGLTNSIIMSKTPNRELRKRYSKLSNQVGIIKEYDNTKIAKRIIEIMFEKAKIKREKTPLVSILKDTMAQNHENVMKLVNSTMEASQPYRVKKFNEIQNFAKKRDGIEFLKPYDYSYYLKLYKKETQDIDLDKLKKFFTLENVVNNGLFATAKKLYNIDYKKVPSAKLWHKDSQVWQVFKDGKKIAMLYLDPLERVGTKRDGAWKHVLAPRRYSNEIEKSIPHIIIVTNMQKDISGKVYLKPGEITTLFHEFGHQLHELFQNPKYPELSNTSRDFVEIPSQLYENYATTDQVIKDMSLNGSKKINQKYIDMYKRSLNEGTENWLNGVSRQSMLDQMYYSTDPSKIDNILEFENSFLSKYNIFKDYTNETPWLPTFSHIITGGYKGEYYSYLWTQIYAQLTWKEFKKEGIYSKNIAQRYAKLLKEAGVIPESEAYKNFIGKDVSMDELKDIVNEMLKK